MPVPGQIMNIRLQLHDGAEDKFPQATLTDTDKIELGASPVSLTHILEGLYGNSEVLFPTTQGVTATLVTFNDAGHTAESGDHFRVAQQFNRDSAPLAVGTLVLAKNQLEGTLQGVQEIEGTLERGREVVGTLEKNEITGVLEDAELESRMETGVLEGTIEKSELEGKIEC